MKAEKVLEMLATAAPRWAGVVTGPPGSGKTTFLKALLHYYPDIITVSVKDNLKCQKINVSEEIIARRISGVLHFTASDGLRISFDILNGKKLEEIENQAGKFKPEVAEWIINRIRALKSLKNNNGEIEVPTCLNDFDEIIRRLVIGILYVARPPIPIIMDDALAFVINRPYYDAFSAMMRPYLFSINRYLDSRELLQFNPVIITPGGAGVSAGVFATTPSLLYVEPGGPDRLARPEKYVVLYDGKRYEIRFEDIQRIAEGKKNGKK